MTTTPPNDEWVCPECGIRLVNAPGSGGYDADGNYLIGMGCTQCDGLFGKAPTGRIVRIVNEVGPEDI